MPNWNQVLEEIKNSKRIDEAVKIGLIVKSLEKDFDQEFQDLVLTVHHSYMHTFANSIAGKIIENQSGNAVIYYYRTEE